MLIGKIYSMIIVSIVIFLIVYDMINTRDKNERMGCMIAFVLYIPVLVYLAVS